MRGKKSKFFFQYQRGTNNWWTVKTAFVFAKINSKLKSDMLYNFLVLCNIHENWCAANAISSRTKYQSKRDKIIFCYFPRRTRISSYYNILQQ